MLVKQKKEKMALEYGIPRAGYYTLVTPFTMYPRSQKNAGVHRSYSDLNWSAKIQVFYALFRL